MVLADATNPPAAVWPRRYVTLPAIHFTELASVSVMAAAAASLPANEESWIVWLGEPVTATTSSRPASAPGTDPLIATAASGDATVKAAGPLMTLLLRSAASKSDRLTASA